jgi:hypothetical protein
VPKKEQGQTTYEEATRCPKCEQPGNVRLKEPAGRPAPGTTPLPKGTQLHTVYCENTFCKWYNSCWIVQVNPDGTVPAAKNHTGEPKIYQGQENADQVARDILRALEIQNQRSTEPGAEIRNPFGR